MIVSPNQGYSLTVGAGATISFGSLPAATPGVYYDLIQESGGNLRERPGELHPTGGEQLPPGSTPNGDIAITAVPEPGTLALLGAGLMSLLTLAWRRRNAG